MLQLGFKPCKVDPCVWLREMKNNYYHLPKQEYEWTRTVYGNVKEEILKDIPKPLGKRLITTTFLDANLLHDIVTKNKSQLYCTLSTPPQQTGSQRDKPLWRQQHMVQSL